jgi:hypothetical protein
MKPSSKGPSQVEKNKDRFQKAKNLQLQKKEDKLSKMTDVDITNELKGKGLPTYGTKAERLARLRKAWGMPSADDSSKNKDKTLGEIERIKQKREQRRAKMLSDVKAFLRARNMKRKKRSRSTGKRGSAPTRTKK